jgi:hypothetical protein
VVATDRLVAVPARRGDDVGLVRVRDAVEVRHDVLPVLQREHLNPRRQRTDREPDRRPDGDDVGDVELAAGQRVPRRGDRDHPTLAVPDQHDVLAAAHPGAAHRGEHALLEGGRIADKRAAVGGEAGDVSGRQRVP